MNLSFEPVYHRKIRSHTGYLWEATSNAPDVVAEGARIYSEGGTVISPAVTPPGVGRWPWEDRTKPRAKPGTEFLTSAAALFAIPVGLALSAVLAIPVALAAAFQLRAGKAV